MDFDLQFLLRGFFTDAMDDFRRGVDLLLGRFGDPYEDRYRIADGFSGRMGISRRRVTVAQLSCQLKYLGPGLRIDFRVVRKTTGDRCTG